MTFNKAYRRYPYHTKIKYIGDKVFDSRCIQYGFEEMTWRNIPVSNGSIGVVDGFIFDKDDLNNVIGIEVLFEVPLKHQSIIWSTMRFETVKLYFGKDIFVRAF